MVVASAGTSVAEASAVGELIAGSVEGAGSSVASTATVGVAEGLTGASVAEAAGKATAAMSVGMGWADKRLAPARATTPAPTNIAFEAASTSKVIQ